MQDERHRVTEPATLDMSWPGSGNTERVYHDQPIRPRRPIADVPAVSAVRHISRGESHRLIKAEQIRAINEACMFARKAAEALSLAGFDGGDAA